jgi:Ca2+:H+ antiporter
MPRAILGLPAWSVLAPGLALLALAATYGGELGGLLIALVALFLAGAVFSAVHHAEVIAHKVGEPFGTLVLALAVTAIETSLLVALMLAGGAEAMSLARDTVFATVMIVATGVLGACLLVGGLRHGAPAFRVEGTTPMLAVLAALATTTLVLPNFTTSTPGPTLTAGQLGFTAVASLALYGVFVFVQTVRHRDYFLPVADADGESHAPPPSARTSWTSALLLVVALVGVVGLAKVLAPSIESAVDGAGAPRAVVGIAIALLVLLPETLAAVRAAARDRLQTSLNLGLGSALATIGLTVPAVALVSRFLPHPLMLGLPAMEMALLALTMLISGLTLSGGRATVLQGAVHLVLFALFLFLAVIP